METEQHEQRTSTTSHIARNIFLFILVIILIIATAATAYFYRENKAKKQLQEKQASISQLEQKVSDLQKQLTDAQKTTATSTANTTATVPSTATLDNIKAAITSGNTAALEGYMAPSVTVIIAASEGIGTRTPMQAVSDLSYLKNSKNWNFSLDAATLKLYANGDYKAYFKANSLVGKASDGHVVVFNFNDQGKINGIFMAVNDDLLK